MPQVTVNVFTGIEPQFPDVLKVEGNIYQDIVTALINSGIESGQIYGINGENIDYNGWITMDVINYVIPEGITYEVYLRDVLHKMKNIKIKSKGHIRDIYNKLIAEGSPINTTIVYEGKKLPLDDRVDRYNFRDVLWYHSPRTVNERRAIKYRVNTLSKGEVEVDVIPETTNVRNILRMVNPNNEGNMKLALVDSGAHNIHVYGDNDYVRNVKPNQKLYLVPDYETLYACCSAKS